MKSDRRWSWAAAGAALALTACSRDREEATPRAPAASARAAAPAAPAPAARPDGADAVDTALAAAKAFDGKTSGDLTALSQAQRRMHELVVQAGAIARQADQGTDAERKGAPARFAAVRTAAQAAHDELVLGLAAFQEAAAEQTGKVDEAVSRCGQPALANYAPCAELATEQALLQANVAALTKQYAAAEAAYQKDRGAMAEAATAVSLAR